MFHHYCIVNTAVHGQEMFKTKIHFPNHEHLPRVVAGRRLGVPKSTGCSSPVVAQ